MNATTTTTITCTIAARVEGPATEREARYGIRPMSVCGRPAVAFSEADGHRSYYCPTHAERVEARGLYTRPVG